MIGTLYAAAMLFLLRGPAPAHAAATKIGAAGAVSGLVKAMAAQDPVGRVIESGKPLFLNDHVTTDSKGRLQVMLLDETIFTIGPDSDMMLDEFVYDPATDAGKVSAKITKGVFRFVTGKVARKDPANMKVKLAVGTIGIRGTIAAGRTGEQGSTVILLGPGAQNNANETSGAITVENGGSSVLIDQPGFGVNVTPGQQNFSVSDMSLQAGQLTSDLAPSDTSSSSGGGGSSSGGSSSAGGGGTAGNGGTGSNSPESGTPSGGEQAGQTTALAGTSLNASADSSFTAQLLDDTASQAQQDIISNNTTAPAAIVDGISTWDNVRSVQTGVVTYSGNGYSSDMYPMSLNLEVDFGARTYGGDASNIFLSMRDDSTTITKTGFGDLTGPAVVTLTAGTNSTNDRFDNSTLTFNNLSGVAADNVSLSLNYAIPQGGTLNGQLTATKQ